MLEPISGSSPKFSTETKISSLLRVEKEPLELTCPAQGSPVPNFRSIYYILIFCKARFIRIVHAIINGNIKFIAQYLEPLSGSSPKMSNLIPPVIIMELDQVASLTCPVQSYPVPSFR